MSHKSVGFADVKSVYPRDPEGQLLALNLTTGRNTNTSRAGVLRCPCCGWDCTHGDDVFVSTASGDVTHLRASGEDDSAEVVEVYNRENPIPDAGRRHAIAIRFWCEECGCRFTLEFLQHKGETRVEVRTETWTPA